MKGRHPQLHCAQNGEPLKVLRAHSSTPHYGRFWSNLSKKSQIEILDFKVFDKSKWQKTYRSFIYKTKIYLILCMCSQKNARNLSKMKHFANFHGFYYTAMAEKSSQHTHSDRFGPKSTEVLSVLVWTSVLYWCPTLEGPRKKCRTKKLDRKMNRKQNLRRFQMTIIFI